MPSTNKLSSILELFGFFCLVFVLWGGQGLTMWFCWVTKSNGNGMGCLGASVRPLSHVARVPKLRFSFKNLSEKIN